MRRLQRTSFGNKGRARAEADPFVSPERYRVHPVGDPWWGDFHPVPLVTVALGKDAAVLRLCDVSASKPLSPNQWSRAREAAERVAIPIGEGDETPAVFFHQTLLVQLPGPAEAERLARFLLTLATPTGPLP
jgi:hypothetical protein